MEAKVLTRTEVEKGDTQSVERGAARRKRGKIVWAFLSSACSLTDST